MADDYDELFGKFLRQASTLGIPKDEQAKYVRECFERSERQREREAKQKEKEEETKQKELEALIKQKEIDAAVKQKEIEMHQALELEKEKTKQAEADVHRDGNEGNHSARTRTDRPVGAKPVFPKLPRFVEKHDDIDSFMFRFETHATSLNWEKSQWVTYLAALLEGNALNLYHSLSANQGSVVTYEVLKENLLKKFQCTAEGFRKRFREARPDANEPLQTYGIGLTRLFERWIALSGVERTTEGIMNLILGEQFLESVSGELATFIRERNLCKLDDMVKAAESYRLARPGKQIARKSTATVFASVGSVDIEFENAATGYSDSRGGFSTPRSRRSTGRRGGFQKPARGQTQQNVQGQNTRGTRSRGNFHSNYEACPLCDGKGHSPRQCPLRSCQNPCPICNIGGHTKKTCPFVLAKLQGKPDNVTPSGSTVTILHAGPEVVCSVKEASVGHLHLEAGTVNKTACSVLRDTGATICGVRRRLVPPSSYLQRSVQCKTFGGEINEYPQAKVTVSSPYFSGDLVCCVLEDPVADLIIGNIPGVEPQAAAVEAIAAVTTRARAKREDVPHKPLVDVCADLTVSRDELIAMQKNDPTLKGCFTLAESGERKTIGSAVYSFYIKDGVLSRCYEQPRKTLHQIVVPQRLRATVLTTAHDQLLAAHCGTRRTLLRILNKFFWPGVNADVGRYIHTCDICQRTVAKGKVQPVPLATMPRISTPFERVAIDLVGPLSPPSEGGHRYILTLIDLATRFPEAVPLKDISSVDVAEALLSIFARLGFPKEILSDQGTQFNSDLMKQFHALCGTKAIRTSPYHPQANGTVERFHGTLKSMLKKVIHSKPKAWHRYLPALLFACRELPSESTGFSPFELMYGRTPRGPIALLADSWSQTKEDDTGKPVYTYLFELKNILAEACEVATQNSTQSARRSKTYFDKKAKPRTFDVDDEVLILLPTDANKLLMTWSGPFRVTECLHPDYRIDVRGRLKIFHANMLKKYLRREETAAVGTEADHQTAVSVGTFTPWTDICSLALCQQEEYTQEHSPERPLPDPSVSVGVIQDDDDTVCSIPVPMSPSTRQEDINMIDFNKDLKPSESQKLINVFSEFTDRLTTNPGTFNGNIMLDINLTTDIPVRKRAYDLPFSSKLTVEKEVKTMLDMGVIEKSKSAYSSPVVLVQKKDNSCRFCVDYRALNKITTFDAEPIPDVEEMFTQLSASEYFTRIDLAKGYWQIVVNPVDRHKTAFATHIGLYQWIRMPFGLVSAPAVFARMMRELDLPQVNSMNFFDDILCHSRTFQQHLTHVRGVLMKLREFNLTASPSKISAGQRSLEFLGHIVGEGMLRPEQKKVQKILAIPTPTTKKQVRSLLGLLGFYRRYVPNFATLTAPISDLTKDSKSRTIAWTPACEEALRQIKTVFSSAPVLQLPNLEESFVLQTDASATGIGAVLLQEHDGTLHPICFASRKLLDRETRYSTIERECLAIVWSISKFAKFLWGAHFTLQTDHRPLTYLQTSRFKNSRIMRWSLSLQEYKFTVEPLPGTRNVIADLLSRAHCDQMIP